MACGGGTNHGRGGLIVATVVLTIIAVPFLVRALWDIALSAWAWRVPPAPEPSTSQRFLVLVAAHNEERVIAAVVSDALGQNYPSEMVDVWVIADRCDDATAANAEAVGARVAVRNEEPYGKGAAIAWFLSRRPLTEGEALVVLDADNRVTPEFLGRFAAELAAGHDALQAYLGVTNPTQSPITLASALMYWSSSRLIQLSRTNVGWSCHIGGTGVCIRGEALTRTRGYGDSQTEDRDLELQLVEVGVKVRWIHDLKLRDEKPADIDTLARQRARWAAGKRANRRDHSARLWATARAGSWTALDRLIELVMPSRQVSAALLGLLGLIGLVAAAAPWFPWVMFGTVGVTVLLVLIALAAEGVPLKHILLTPLLMVFVVIWLPVQVLSRRQQGWFSTPHTGNEEGSESI